MHVDHRIGRGRTLAEVDDRIRLEFLEDLFYAAVLPQVPVPESRLFAEALFERTEALVHVADGQCARGAHFFDPLPTEECICPGHLMAARREILRERPAQVTVHSRDEYAHALVLESGFLSRRAVYIEGSALSNCSGTRVCLVQDSWAGELGPSPRRKWRNIP